MTDNDEVLTSLKNIDDSTVRIDQIVDNMEKAIKDYTRMERKVTTAIILYSILIVVGLANIAVIVLWLW